MSKAATTFQSRLDRINAGKTIAWTAPGEGLASRAQVNQIQKLRGNTKVKPKGTSNAIVLPLACLVGGGSIWVGRWIAFQYFTEAGAFGYTGLDVINQARGDFALAVVLAMFLRWALYLTTPIRTVAVLFSFLTMTIFGNELVAAAPDVFAETFSPAWVSQTLNPPT